jgi:O-antigen/teichoic acid export membrane protein
MAVLAAVLAVRSRQTVTQALRQPPSWALIWRMFVFGVPLAGTSLSAWVTSLSDRILLAGLAGSPAAGVYAVGYQIGSNIILLPSSVLMASAYPVLLQEYQSEGAGAAARMLRTLTSTAVLAGIATVIAVISMAPLLVLGLGAAYRSSLGIIPLVAAAHLLMAITEYYAKSFQLTNRTARLFLVSALVALVSVAANVTLVPLMGMYGSAVAALVAGAVALGVTVGSGRPLLRFDLGRMFALKVGAAAAVSGAAAHLLPPVVDVVSLPAVATLGPVLAFGVLLVAVREQTTIALLRSCTGGRYR